MTTIARPRLLNAPVADPTDAATHYARKLSFEADCSDVHDAAGATGFVVVDSRSQEAYANGHVPGALSLPYATTTAETTSSWEHDALYVTYCWGPGCNAGDQGALRLAQLGFRVKLMIGGWDTWIADGYPVETSRVP
ncbi:MAG: Rhodanese-like protein [Frankiales bacterium]|nr:Rhodanese-like protein [Frankiales bacterium]